MNRLKKAVITISSVLLVISSVQAAFAHNFVLTPD
jgi:hypothetical protein